MSYKDEVSHASFAFLLLSRGPSLTQRLSTQSHRPHPWPCIRCLSDLQGQTGQEADGQGSEISPHAVVSSDWPRSCVAGRWQSVLSEQSVRGLLFGFCCAAAWQEQLGRCTGFPLFMWGPGISTSAHCCAGGSAPTATYCTIKSVEGHREGEGRGGWEGFLPRILKEGHDTVLWEVIMLYHWMHWGVFQTRHKGYSSCHLVTLVCKVAVNALLLAGGDVGWTVGPSMHLRLKSILVQLSQWNNPVPRGWILSSSAIFKSTFHLPTLGQTRLLSNRLLINCERIIIINSSKRSKIPTVMCYLV